VIVLALRQDHYADSGGLRRTIIRGLRGLRGFFTLSGHDLVGTAFSPAQAQSDTKTTKIILILVSFVTFVILRDLRAFVIFVPS
jgi:hypothetical protein